MNTHAISRRSFVQGATLAAAQIALSAKLASARGQSADAPDLNRRISEAEAFNEFRYGHMTQEYYVSRFREIARQRAERRASIQTPAQVLALKEEVRRKLSQCYGPRPKRAPLNARVTGRVEREHYTIEKVIYESRPHYLVTANVYAPKGRSGRRPAVLGACGHSQNGKAAAPYQEFARNLARQGYVVLLFDPPAQGERTEYPDRPDAPPVRYGVESHNLAGNQMTLIGRNFAMWEAWDGIRGVDYLISRDDVDPRRIGVTGNSGGGTQTSHLNALEDRFTMAAPNCFVTRFIHNLENEEPTDAEQVVPGMVAAGLDMADFFIAQIPRPTLLGGERNDFFDVRGLRSTYEELRRLYAILGRESDVEIYVGPETHGYRKGARENMYRFFNQHAGINGSPGEPDEPVEPDEVLQVTEQGQVHRMNSSRAFDFTQAAAADLQSRRKKAEGEALKESVANVLALPARSGAPYYRVMRARTVFRNPTVQDFGFVVETEPRCVSMLHAIPQSGPLYHFPPGERAALYIPHRSSLKEWILGRAKDIEDEPVRFLLDVRGMGQLTARTHKDSGDDFFHSYHSDYMYSNMGLLLDEPYCGRRVHDLLSVLDLFQAHGYKEIHLIGRGLGSITASFAALLHPIVKQATLHNALLSYYELTQASRYQWPFSSMVFDVLNHFDLPDCLRQLAVDKSLRVVDPWNSQMEPWDRSAFADHVRSLGLNGINISWPAA